MLNTPQEYLDTLDGQTMEDHPPFERVVFIYTIYHYLGSTAWRVDAAAGFADCL